MSQYPVTANDAAAAAADDDGVAEHKTEQASTSALLKVHTVELWTMYARPLCCFPLVQHKGLNHSVYSIRCSIAA